MSNTEVNKMILSIAQGYFKTAFNSRSIVVVDHFKFSGLIITSASLCSSFQNLKNNAGITSG